VPTKAPLTSRDTSETVRVATTTLSLPSQTASDSTSTAPTSPAFITGRSASAHLGTAWQIEHSIFVSKGGGDASVLYCPTPEDFHRHLWDPNFGRGGKLVEERRLLMGKHGLKGYRGGEDKVPMSAENIQAKIKIKTRSKFRARCSLRRCRERKTKSASTPSVPGSYNARPDDFVPLPENTRIPHGVFARKHGIIPEGDTMPVFILRGERQPTIDEISLKKCEEVFPRAITLAKKLGDLRSLDENDAAELQEKSVDAYLSQIPSTPGLFFDSGIEYKWDTETTSPQLFPLQFSAPSCIMKENLTHDYPKDLPHFPTASVPNLTAPGLSVTTRSQDPDQNQGMTLDVTHTLSLESHNRDLNGPPVAGWHALPVSTQETVLSKHCSSARPVDCEYEGAPERELKQRHLNAVRSIGGRNDKHPTLCGHLQARKSGNSPRLVPRIERNPLRQRSVEQENEPGDGPVLVRKARTLNRDRGQARSFDGTRDDFHFSYDNNSNKQTYSHNTHNTNKLHNKTHNEKFLSALMDPDQLFTQPPAVSPTKPLHVRKQSSKTHLERSQQQLSDNNPYKNYSKTPIYPPRTSSIQKFVPCNASEIFQARETINDSSPTLNSARSTFSSYRGTYLSDTSAEVPSTARTTLERHEAHGISNLTSGIMGDFIPIDQDATNHSRATESGKPSFDVYVSLPQYVFMP
jgi:hypothetical protein